MKTGTKESLGGYDMTEMTSSQYLQFSNYETQQKRTLYCQLSMKVLARGEDWNVRHSSYVLVLYNWHLLICHLGLRTNITNAPS